MKKIFRFPFFFSVFLFIPFLAKPQLIKDEFSIPAFSDQFDGDSDTWKNMSNSDNLFLIQDGAYLLRRKNQVTGYSIFPKWKVKLSAYSLTASIKLEEGKNEESAVGLIFMAQEDASGAFIFEFNAKNQYRLKQLVGLSFKLLTGDVKKGGWVDSDVLNPIGQYNLVEVRTSKRNYDVYVNEKYLLSFTEIAYKTGDIGIAIGPATKASVDFITIKESKGSPGKNPLTPSDAGPGSRPLSGNSTYQSADNINSVSGSADVAKLKEQISSLKMENQLLRDSLNIVKRQLRAAKAGKEDQEVK